MQNASSDSGWAVRCYQLRVLMRSARACATAWAVYHWGTCVFRWFSERQALLHLDFFSHSWMYRVSYRCAFSRGVVLRTIIQQVQAAKDQTTVLIE